MFYVIDNFYHIFSSLYAYRCLSLSCGGRDRVALPLGQSRRPSAGRIPGRR